MLVYSVYWRKRPQSVLKVISFELIAFKRCNPARKLWAIPIKSQISSHM